MSVYEPAEDSFLLKNYIQELDLEGKKTLDMGTGSGIVGFTMAEKGAEVTAVDINSEAVEETKGKAEKKGIEIDVRKSDLFENIEGKFDLVAFNPPYLPGEKGVGDEEIWRGGKKGIELTEEFLDETDKYLQKDGFALLIISTRSEHEHLMEEYKLEIVDKREMWFETLLIVRYK